MYYASELEKWAKNNININFLGIFASNELSKLKPLYNYPYYFIINTDNNNLSGQHWICIYMHDKKIGEIFDSFGKFPNFYVQRWLNKNSNKWYYNPKLLQPPLSTNCGLFCLYFIYFRCINPTLTLNQFVDYYFTYDVYKNDYLVTQFYYNKS